MKQHLQPTRLFLVITLCLLTNSLWAQTPLADMPQAPASPKGIQGIWIWRFDTIADPIKRQELLDFCQSQHINRLLVQMHMTKGNDQLRDAAALTALITQAADRNIAVEALEGDPAMAEKANQPNTLKRLEVILAFNQTLPDGKKMVGLHYDIEPYILPQWKKGGDTRLAIMRNLLDFAHLARKQLIAQQPPMTLSFDIPFWYDHKVSDKDNCILTYNDQTKNFYQHILDVSDYIGIMSYRTKAQGSNGVLKHVQSELDYARKIGKTIVPALETIELKSSPTITFFGKPASEFWIEHNKVRQALADDPAFGGMFTHSYRGLKDLTIQPNTEKE
ncbi:MAG TPA: hypothetical protein DER01_18205 [Phycisphaerales bacterium]|nr:hypothetical protein [Phycisphaerales bacterium]